MSHRILIIDDSQTVLTSLAGALRHDGYDVETLSHFMDLSRTLERFCPEVILLDLQMPGFSGVQFARFIQQFSTNPPPILFHSGSAPEVVRDAAREIRPFEVVRKGTPLREIRRAIARATTQAKYWSALESSTHERRTSRPPRMATGS